jgi:16S rRNA (adenine1518-N6/adenine1519-N6)-dimethyltransferase
LDEYASPKRVLAARGLRPRKRLGQNFLVDPRFAQRIASALPSDAFVLEIGGGTGALTAALARVARQLKVVEIDRGLVEILRERFAGDDERIGILAGDILDLDLRATLAAHRRPRAICGNLPYSITTPLLERIVAAADAWDCAVLMVQREYAKRLTAKPGTPEYGSLTLFVAHFCEAERLFDVGAAGFYPAPAVASSVVRLRPKPDRATSIDDSTLLLWLIRAAFAQRRKTLVNSIAGQPGAPTREALDAAVRTIGLRPDIRGERLALADFERLASALHAQGFRTPVR